MSIRRRIAAAVLAVAVACGWVAPVAAQTGAGQDFTDINGHWAAATIQAMLAAGIVEASADGRFYPDKPVTRLDFTVWLSRALELDAAGAAKPPFKDWNSIPARYQGAIAAAYAAGLVQGYPDKTFRPSATITRAELATLFGRSLMQLGVPAESRWFAIFADGDKIPSWALPAAAAVSKFVILGQPGVPGQKVRFAPNDTATRAEALTMLDRFMQVRNEINPNPLPTPQPKPLGDEPFFASYYVNTDYGYQTLLKHGASLDFIVYTGFSLGADGSLAGHSSPRTMEWDAQTGKPMLAMFEAHSRDANNKLLQNPDARAAAVRNIVDVVNEGYAGINLDMEYVDASLRPNYTQFVKEIADALHPLGKIVTLSVWAKTSDSPTNSLSGVYDYAALGQIADYIMLMTYDYHWVGGPPGPIAPISWVRNVVAYAVTQIPSRKVLVGIPTYAYLWPNNGGRGRATAAWDAAATAASLGIVPQRVPEGEVTFTAKLSDGVTYTYYYNDVVAIQQKIALVGQYQLGGAIMWRLGFEDDAAWPALLQAFAQVRGVSPSQ